MVQKIRVGINGYGVIGKRAADAVALQDDMELAGVANVVHDYRIRVALERGYPVFAATPETDASLGITKNFLPSGELVSIPHLGGPDVPHPVAAAVRAAHIACLCEGFKGAEEPVEWEE